MAPKNTVKFNSKFVHYGHTLTMAELKLVTKSLQVTTFQ